MDKIAPWVNITNLKCFIKLKFIQMAKLDQEYWTQKIDITEWSKRHDELADATIEYIASLEPKAESEVL